MLFDYYKFIESRKIREGSLSNSTEDTVDPYDNHVLNCGENAFTEMKLEAKLSYYKYDDESSWRAQRVLEERAEEEDVDGTELKYCNGSKAVVKFFNQKCVICGENPSVDVFRQCGHQCICEKLYQRKSNRILLDYVICRT